MAICPPSCNATLPPKLFCPDEFRNAGINRIFFIPCYLEFFDIYDVTEWCDYYQNGELQFTAPVLGQKPKANIIKRRISSCNPEKVMGRTNTITFQDFNADDIGFKDYDFWNTFMEKPHLYQFGFMTCDEHFYGFFQGLSLDIDDIIEDDVTKNTYWDGMINWTSYLNAVPKIIPGLMAALLGGCVNVPPPPPSCCKRWRPLISSTATIVNSTSANVTITFDHCIDAVDYIITFTVNGGAPQVFNNVSGSPFVVNNVPQGANYTFTIVANCGALQSNPKSGSGNVPTWPCCAPLNGTNNFRITNVTSTPPDYTVDFELDLPTGQCSPATSVSVAYKIGNGPWSSFQGPFTPVGSLVTGSLVIPANSAGQIVSFQYFTDCGNGVTSATVQATTTWPSPGCCLGHNFNLTLVEVVGATDSQVNVDWADCATATLYNIRYRINGGAWISDTVTPPTSSYVINSVPFSALVEVELYADCNIGSSIIVSKSLSLSQPPCCDPTVTIDYGNITVVTPTIFIPFTFTNPSGNCFPTPTLQFRWKRTTGGVFSAWDLAISPLEIPDTEVGQDLTFEFRNDCGGGVFSNAFTTNVVLPCCPPLNFTVTVNVATPTGLLVQFDWDECYANGSVIVEYQRNGDPAPIPVPSSGVHTGSPFVAPTGVSYPIPINANTTTIDFFARTSCSATSESTNVIQSISVTPPCCTPTISPISLGSITMTDTGLGATIYHIPVTINPGTGNCANVTSYTLFWARTGITCPDYNTVWTQIPNFVSGSNVDISGSNAAWIVEFQVQAVCPSGISVNSAIESVTIPCGHGLDASVAAISATQYHISPGSTFNGRLAWIVEYFNGTSWIPSTQGWLHSVSSLTPSGMDFDFPADVLNAVNNAQLFRIKYQADCYCNTTGSVTSTGPILISSGQPLTVGCCDLELVTSATPPLNMPCIYDNQGGYLYGAANLQKVNPLCTLAMPYRVQFKLTINTLNGPEEVTTIEQVPAIGFNDFTISAQPQYIGRTWTLQVRQKCSASSAWSSWSVAVPSNCGVIP